MGRGARKHREFAMASGEMDRDAFVSFLSESLGVAIRATMVPIHAGIVHPTQPPARIEKAAATCDRLNGEILRRSLTEDRIHALASPVTGGGVRVSRLQQLFLYAVGEDARSPDEWARFAWSVVGRNDADRDLEPSDDRPTTFTILREALNFLQCLPHFAALKLVDEKVRALR